MKRFVVILGIVTLVFAVSAGPAFASSCACNACAESAMQCSLTPVSACSMPTTHPAAFSPSPCGTSIDRAVHESTPAEIGLQRAGVAVSAVVPGTPLVRACPMLSIVLADARGAPHLTALLRI